MRFLSKYGVGFQASKFKNFVCINLITWQPLGIGNIIVLISQLRKLRLRKNKKFDQGRTAGGKDRGLRPVLTDSKVCVLPF